MTVQHRLNANNSGSTTQLLVGDEVYIDLSAHLPDEWQLSDPVKWIFGSRPLSFGHNGDQTQAGFIVSTTLHLVASIAGTETVELELVNPYSAGPRKAPVPSQTLRFDFVIK